MSIKLINYDLINRRPQISVSFGAIRSEIREDTALEQLMRRQGLLKEGEQPTFYVAPYSKYINVDDLTNHAPKGTVLLATSSAQLYFGSPEVKAAIKTLMPLETQIPGYARGLFAKGQAQSLERPLKVLVVDHETGENNYGIPEIAIRNIAGDGASIIDRAIGEQMKLIDDVGLSQVRGYSLDPKIGSYYIKGTVTPLNLQKYFATHGVDVDVDLVLTTSMLKGLGGGKLSPEIGIHQVEPQDLFITRTERFCQTTAKLGSVQDLYAIGLAKDVSIPVQTAIQDLQQKQMDLISLAEDYVRTFKISQQEEVRKGKPEVELPGNIAFIDTILESKNWGLLELPSVRANLQEYVDGQIKNINEGAIKEMRGEFRPIVVCGELKHNQIAGSGLTTGDKHVALRFPVLNRGQVQAVEVNNNISFFLNPELEGIIPDAIYIGRQTLAEIEQDDPETYQKIIEEFESIAAAQASWRTNLEAMKADFDGDEIALFAENNYPNFYQEVVDNLKPEKLMHFVSKDKKQLIQSEDLPGMVVERLKDYVGIINSNLGRINTLYSSLDFIIAGTEGDLKSTEKLQAETLQLIYDSFQKYRDTAESLVEPDVTLNLKIPAELQATFDRFAPFYSVDFIKLQVDNPRAQSNYLYTVKDSVSMLLGAYTKKSLNATPINAKKGIVFSPDLIKDMEQMKFMKLKSIREGSANPDLLVEYLDNYAKIHAQLSKIIDLSQPLVSNLKSIDPRTNAEIIFTTNLKVTPNHTYDPSQIDKYLRDYQTIVLRKCIEVVDKENQRSVDFVKSGVKPNEGTVYAVTDKLPELDASIQLLKRFIVEENHQNRLPPSSSMTLNALIGQLRSVSVEPEMKAVVANFRDDYQNLQSTIALETQALQDFKHGKPIVLNIYTTNDSKIVLSNCNVSEINTFRQLEGKGSISTSDGLVTFYPDDSTNWKGINYEYVLGATAKTSGQIEGKQQIGDFEFEVLHDRIDELKADSRAVLAEFRNVIEQRGWNKQEVFAATTQLVGEKAISQDFLLSCLPDILNQFVFEQGAQNIILDTEYANYLTKPTEYFVTTGENDTKNLRALAEVDGKQQWIEAGQLTGYGIQLLDKTSFQGKIEPNYNTVTIEVYSGETRIGEITQTAEQKFWGNRINELENATEISIKVQSVIPKQVGYKVSIDENTLYNSNVWADVEPARTYQRTKKDEVQSPKLTAKELKSAEFKSDRVKAVLEEASRNLRRQADSNSFPQSFSVKVTVPVVDESGLKEMEQLQLVIPDNKLHKIEKHFNQDEIKYTKIERGIPDTYEESRRGYTVLRINTEELDPKVKTTISKQLGKPVSQADYQAKLADIPIIREWVPIKLNNLKQWIEQYPQSTDIPVLDLDKSKPVPFALKPITGEVQTRFKGKAMAINNSIIFEFVNDRQRDTAMYHLGLPIKAELPTEDGKTRYFAIVEAATLQTYLNDRAVNHVLVKDGIKRDNPILASYGTNKDWTKLPSRSQVDIVMGFAANKYIGIPLEAKSRTTMYRDNWAANANTTTYKSTDVVMVTPTKNMIKAINS